MSNSLNIQQLYRKALQIKSLANTSRNELLNRIRRYKLASEEVKDSYDNNELIKSYGMYLEKLRPNFSNESIFTYPSIDLQNEINEIYEIIETEVINMDTGEIIPEKSSTVENYIRTDTILLNKYVDEGVNETTETTEIINTETTEDLETRERTTITTKQKIIDIKTFKTVSLTGKLVTMKLLSINEPLKCTYIVALYKYGGKLFISVNLLKIDDKYVEITELSKPLEILHDEKSILFDNLFSMNEIHDSTIFSLATNPITSFITFRVILTGDLDSFYKTVLQDIIITPDYSDPVKQQIELDTNNRDYYDYLYQGDVKDTAAMDDYVHSIGLSTSGTLTSELVYKVQSFFKITDGLLNTDIVYINNLHVNTIYNKWDKLINKNSSANYILGLIQDDEKQLRLKLTLTVDENTIMTKLGSMIILLKVEPLVYGIDKEGEEIKNGSINDVEIDFNSLNKTISFSYRDKIILYSSYDLTENEYIVTDYTIEDNMYKISIKCPTNSNDKLFNLYDSDDPLLPLHFISDIEGRWLSTAILYNGVRYYSGDDWKLKNPETGEYESPDYQPIGEYPSIYTFLNSLQNDYITVALGYDANYNLCISKHENYNWTKTTFQTADLSTGKWQYIKESVESYIVDTNSKWGTYQGIKDKFPDVVYNNSLTDKIKYRYTNIFHIWSTNLNEYIYFITFNELEYNDTNINSNDDETTKVYLIIKDENKTYVSEDMKVEVDNITISDINLVTISFILDGTPYKLKLRFSKIFERYWNNDTEKLIPNDGYVKRYHIERKLMAAGVALDGKLISAISYDYGNTWTKVNFESEKYGVINGLSNYYLTRSQALGDDTILLNDHYGFSMIGIDTDEHAEIHIYNKVNDTWYNGLSEILATEHYFSFVYKTIITENTETGNDDIQIILTPIYNTSFINDITITRYTYDENGFKGYIELSVSYVKKWAVMNTIKYRIPFIVSDETGEYECKVKVNVDTNTKNITVSLTCKDDVPISKDKTKYYKFTESDKLDEFIFTEKSTNQLITLKLDYNIFSKKYYRYNTELMTGTSLLKQTKIFNNYWIKLYNYTINSNIDNNTNIITVDLVLNQTVPVQLEDLTYTINQTNYNQLIGLNLDSIPSDTDKSKIEATKYKQYPRIIINPFQGFNYDISVSFEVLYDRIYVKVKGRETEDSEPIEQEFYIYVILYDNNIEDEDNKQVSCCLNMTQNSIDVFTVAQPFAFNDSNFIIKDDYTLFYNSEFTIGIPITNNLYILDKVRTK